MSCSSIICAITSYFWFTICAPIYSVWFMSHMLLSSAAIPAACAMPCHWEYPTTGHEYTRPVADGCWIWQWSHPSSCTWPAWTEYRWCYVDYEWGLWWSHYLWVAGSDLITTDSQLVLVGRTIRCWFCWQMLSACIPIHTIMSPMIYAIICVSIGSTRIRVPYQSMPIDRRVVSWSSPASLSEPASRQSLWYSRICCSWTCWTGVCTPRAPLSPNCYTISGCTSPSTLPPCCVLLWTTLSVWLSMTSLTAHHRIAYEQCPIIFADPPWPAVWFARCFCPIFLCLRSGSALIYLKSAIIIAVSARLSYQICDISLIFISITYPIWLSGIWHRCSCSCLWA